MSDEALAEFAGGYSGDIDDLFFSLEDSVYSSLYGGLEPNANAVSVIKQFEHLSSNMEEVLCISSLAYFISAKIPQFKFNWHHFEWASFAENFSSFCVIAARNTGKSYFWSMAYIVWKMYRYRNPANYRGMMAQELGKSKRGILITNAIQLAKLLLSILKDVIESSDELNEALGPRTANDWGKEAIRCGNGAQLQCYGSGGKIRGEHPGYGVVDDFLNDSSIYSKEQRDKYQSIFTGVISNAVDGQLVVTGCVTRDTIVQTRNGLRRIGDLNPTNNWKPKTFHDMDLDIMGKEGFRNSEKFYVNGIDNTKVIITEKGHKLEGTHRHPLWVMGKDGKADWKRSDEVEVGDYVAVRTGTGFGDDNRVDEINDPELAYFLGLYIAEGYRDKKYPKITIANTDKEIVDWLLSKPLGLEFKIQKSQDWKLSASTHQWRDRFNSLGCEFVNAPYKRVPRAIMEGTKDTVREFLKGAFDGDGCAWTSGRNFGVTYGTASEGLARDIHTLLNHFGIAANVYQRSKVAISKIAHGRHKLWIVDMRGQEARQYMRDIGFRLTRKQAKIKPMAEGERPAYNIPHQGAVLQAARKEKPRFKKAPNGTRNPQCKISITQVSKHETAKPHRLKIISDYLREHGGKGKSLDLIDHNLSKTDICWTKVKSIEDSKAFTMDFVIPDGNSFVGNGILQHNTPFHASDLYSYLKNETEGTFPVFTYPIIYPDGQLLNPRMHGMDFVNTKRSQSTSAVFARENLCMPISSDSSIFPPSTINKAFKGMENEKLLNSRTGATRKYKKIAMGCDFAFGSQADSDYSVFTTWGIDYKNRMWLLHMYREKSQTYLAQCNAILNIYKRFQHDEIIMETNAFQEIFLEFGKQNQLPVISHNTNRWNKNSSEKGIPSLAMKFEQEMVKIPVGDDISAQTATLISDELQNMSWTDKGIRGVGSHDDIVMSIWIASGAIGEEKSSWGFTFA